MNPLELIELCRGEKIYIQTHNFPDPDAIGAAYGLQKLLVHYGLETVICHEGQIDKLSAIKMLNLCDIKMHSYDEIQEDMAESDKIILVDCQKGNGNTTDFVGDEFAAIDHHPTFIKVEYLYKDFRLVGACSSIIAGYYKELGIVPEEKVATALLYGLRMDTLQFSRGVTAFDIDMYAYLFQYASAKLLRGLESNNMEFQDLKAYGTAIGNIVNYGKLGITYVDFSCPDALIATLSDFILALDKVEVAVVFAPRKDGYKFSVRSEREDVHAGDLTNAALKGIGDGGGHAMMAGGFATAAKLVEGDQYVADRVREIFTEVIEERWPQIL